MISTTFAKGWFEGENNSDNYEYFPFFIRRVSYIYEKLLYQGVTEAIKKINLKRISEEERRKLFSSAFDARLELLFLSGYFNYWFPNHPSQREVIRFILDYLYAINPSDPLGASGSYLPRSKIEVKQLVEKEGITENDRLIGELILHLKSASWATTSESIYMAKSIEGPYFIDDQNKFAFIRSYFSLKNPEIWPESAHYKFDKVEICTVYERSKSNFGDISIDFYGNYHSDFNLNHYAKAIVLIDGKYLNNPEEISQIIDYLKSLTLNQMRHFRNIPIKEQMRKMMELHCKVYRNVFSLAGMDWIPTTEMYQLIEKKELKPKTEKNEVYQENEPHDEFTTLTLNLIDDANYDHKYSRFCENLSNFSLKSPKGIEFYGGKATNLGILINKGFRVPKGLVLTTESFKHFMSQNQLYPKIKEIIQNLDIEDTESLNKISHQIKRLISESNIDSCLEEHLMKNLFLKDKFSIRSSATTEDLKEASFAGQFDTYLNVSKEDLIECIKKCWASLFSSRAIYYRIKKGFHPYNVSMAVIIQEMVAAEMAGVCFTQDSLSNLIIEAFKGLGENVVSGSVNPDKITISRDLHKIEGKTDMISQRLIEELAKKSLEIETLFGVTQDIEWAIYKNDIYFLQTRPLSKPVPRKSTKMDNSGKLILIGIPASEGIARGKVCIIDDLSEMKKFRVGDILLAKTTSPEFVVIMSKASGIITQFGGISSHAAIVSRELGIPCIVGCKNLFEKVKDSDKIIMDGNSGKVYYENK